MKKQFIEDIPAVIREYIPDGENAANVLMDILPIGKESIYRRLRGEIPFTFQEIAQISLHLGFSIDTIVGQKTAEHILMGVDLFNSNNLSKTYHERLMSQTKLLQRLKEEKKLNISAALKNIPHIMAVKYENFCNFSFYKWYYQTQNNHPDFLFSHFKLPAEIKQTRAALYTQLVSVPLYEMILDRNILSEITNDLNYFYRRNLINNAELESVKSDLMEMIFDMENITTFGINGRGAEIHVYLSSVDLDSTYFVYETDNNLYSYIQLFAVHFLETVDHRMGVLQREWIKSIKRYSLNITQSAEIERFEFFKHLKQTVKNIGINNSI